MAKATSKTGSEGKPSKPAAKKKAKAKARTPPTGYHIICTYEHISLTYKLRLPDVKKTIDDAEEKPRWMAAPTAPWIKGFLDEDVVSLFGEMPPAKLQGYKVLFEEQEA